MTAEDSFSLFRCPYDFLVALDLESTTDENHSNPSDVKVRRDQGEIIELSFVVINVALKQIVHRQQIYVRPERTTVTPFCTTLTGITPAQLENAELLHSALQTVDNFIQTHFVSQDKKFCFVTHGEWDLRFQMSRETREKGIPLPHYFNVFYDVIREVNHWLVIAGHRTASPKTSINGLCSAINLPHEGRPHSGIDDASNIARISVALLEFTDKCDIENWVATAGIKAHELWMVKNAEGRPDGTGFAVFLSHEEAKQCLCLNGRILGERTILVSPGTELQLEQTKEVRSPFPTAEEIAAATPAPEMKPGDWLCSSCQYHNFASRRSCFKCQAPHPQIVAQQSHGGSGSQNMKPGDWICPNISCKFQNFASRLECMRCRSRRPFLGGSLSKPGLSNKSLPGDWICNNCHLNNFASRTRCLQCGGPHQNSQVVSGGGPRSRPTDRPGDWNCPNDTCRYHNYASRNECYRCGAKKVEGYTPSSSQGQGGSSSMPMKPGDWICPNDTCRYHNFAKRETCAMCNTPASHSTNAASSTTASGLSTLGSLGLNGGASGLNAPGSSVGEPDLRAPTSTISALSVPHSQSSIQNSGLGNASAAIYSNLIAASQSSMSYMGGFGTHPSQLQGVLGGQSPLSLSHGHASVGSGASGLSGGQNGGQHSGNSLFAQGHEYAAYGYNQFGFAGQQTSASYGNYQG
ncbi:hypothetical protein HDU96_000813 [Phlyctochytrium bullatum]|nr:hypothetical protein HDU96_000813 [Phlyctochytrium bullatum]